MAKKKASKSKDEIRVLSPEFQVHEEIISELEKKYHVPILQWLTDKMKNAIALENPLVWRTCDANGVKMVIYDFPFSDGTSGPFVGFNRGLGAIGDLKKYEDPIGVYDSAGNYYTIHVDLRAKNKSQIPVFKIGVVDFFYPITTVFRMGGRVDPLTANLLDDETRSIGQ